MNEKIGDLTQAVLQVDCELEKNNKLITEENLIKEPVIQNESEKIEPEVSLLEPQVIKKNEGIEVDEPEASP